MVHTRRYELLNMNTMILNVTFKAYNGQDNLYVTVTERSHIIVFEREKWLSDNERLWVKIYEDGFASYGLEMQKDPQHGNKRYTWSSRPEVINEYFKLNDTPYQLANYDIGVQEHESSYSCYCSAGILFKKALLLAEYNQSQLKYGWFKFLNDNNTAVSYYILAPRKGISVGKEKHCVEGDDYYIECIDENDKVCLMRLSELSNYYLSRTKRWHLGGVMNTTINI